MPVPSMSDDKDVLSDDSWDDVPGPEPKASDQPKAAETNAAKPSSEPPRPASAPPRPSSSAPPKAGSAPPRPAATSSMPAQAPSPTTSNLPRATASTRPEGARGSGRLSGSGTLIGIPAPSVEAKPSDRPSDKPPAAPSDKPLAAPGETPALRGDSLVPNKRTLMGIAAPVIAPRSDAPAAAPRSDAPAAAPRSDAPVAAPRSDAPDPAKTPAEPFASRRPPPQSIPPEPLPETTSSSLPSPPPEPEDEQDTSRAKRRLASTRKETPEALAAAKKEARSHAARKAVSTAPEKGSRVGPILLMLVVAAGAVWFVLGKQRGLSNPGSDAANNPDPQAEPAQPEAVVAAPAPTPEPSAIASAAPAPEPQAAPSASAAPSATGTPSAAPAPSAEPAKPDERAKAENPTPSEPASADGSRVVIVKLMPPDARLFYKGKSVGKSPVRIELKPGETKRSFEAGRPGYVTRRIVIDGTEPELSVGLRPDPDATP
jgi:hypothetical protein